MIGNYIIILTNLIIKKLVYKLSFYLKLKTNLKLIII